MKYYVIAGESSGDNYGALLIKALKQIDSEADFKFWGGPKMQLQADGQIKSISETSFMGFWEVLKNITKIKHLFNIAKSTISTYQPDVLILIDYPGFNLRILKWAHNLGIKTTFYVSPQLWAWKKKRYKILRDFADLFIVILPFEQAFFNNLKTPCFYYGHPLTEIIPSHNRNLSAVKTVGLFPGSRLQEIEKHLPILVEFSQHHSNLKFIIAGVSHVNSRVYDRILESKLTNLSIVYDQPYDVMKQSDIAITSSGTATLELAMHHTPQIVIYKTSPFSYAIGKQLVKLKHISLVNLIAEKEVVPELIQNELTISNLEKIFSRLKKVDNRLEVIQQYKRIRSLLGDGNVSNKVAEDVLKLIAQQ